MDNDNNAWVVRDEWENEAQTEDKIKCYKAYRKHDILGWWSKV